MRKYIFSVGIFLVAAGLIVFIFPFSKTTVQNAMSFLGVAQVQSAGFRPGVYFWGGTLNGAGGNLLSMGSVILDDIGANTIRIVMSPKSDMDYNSGGCISNFSLKSLAQRGDFNAILSNPQFTTIVVTAIDGVTFGDCTTHKYLDPTFFTPANIDGVSQEYADFANYLSGAFPSKTFIVSNWEGDNAIYCGTAYGFNPSNSSCSYQQNLLGFEKWTDARIAGIRAANAPNVRSAVEFNIVRYLKNNGLPSVLYDVLPNVNPDYVSYSSYESTNSIASGDNGSQLGADVNTIRNITSKEIIIGEYGYAAGTRDQSKTYLETATNEISSLGITKAIVWMSLDSSDGQYGLYDPNAALTPSGEYICGLLSGTTCAASASTKFAIDDRAETTATVNVRSTPSTSGVLLGTQATGAQGTVVGGPTAANGYDWWQVNYDDAPDGWSVENFLQKQTTPPPPAELVWFDQSNPIYGIAKSNDETTNDNTSGAQGYVMCGMQSGGFDNKGTIKMNRPIFCPLTQTAVDAGIRFSNSFNKYSTADTSNPDYPICAALNRPGGLSGYDPGSTDVAIGVYYAKNQQVDDAWCTPLLGVTVANLGDLHVANNQFTDYWCPPNAVVYGGKNAPGKNDSWNAFYCVTFVPPPPPLSTFVAELAVSPHTFLFTKGDTSKDGIITNTGDARTNFSVVCDRDALSRSWLSIVCPSGPYPADGSSRPFTVSMNENDGVIKALAPGASITGVITVNATKGSGTTDIKGNPQYITVTYTAPNNTSLSINNIHFKNTSTPQAIVSMPLVSSSTAVNVVWDTNLPADCTFGGPSWPANNDGATAEHFSTLTSLYPGFNQTYTIDCGETANPLNSASEDVTIEVFASLGTNPTCTVNCGGEVLISKLAVASLSVSKADICVGDTVTWKGDSNTPGQPAYWYGTKNGVSDANGVSAGTMNFSVNIPYTANEIGSYMRYIKVRITKDGVPEAFSTSNTVSVNVRNCATGDGPGSGGTCPDGSPVPASGSCTGGRTCPDGSPVPASGICSGYGSSHTACQNNACVTVPGSGVNQCFNNTDCGGTDGGNGCTFGESRPCDTNGDGCAGVSYCVGPPGVAYGGTWGVCSDEVCTFSAPPTCTFTASPDKIVIPPSGNVALQWNCSNTTNCSISGVGNVNAGGGTTHVSPQATTNYILSCSGPGGSTSNDATVRVFDFSGGTIHEIIPR
ncbi:MAG: SH3 domain-containing protein [bacterium]|nr:SH3 domain-containing protein [bacterium]